MFGGMCGLGFAPATAPAETAGMPGLAAQAGPLPEKAVGTGAETLYVYLSLGSSIASSPWTCAPSRPP
jgi:hypothetical protein